VNYAYPASRNLKGSPDHVPLERDRSLQIADVEDHITDALHGAIELPTDIEVEGAPGFRRDYRCSRVLTGGARAASRCRSGARGW
jgi:hypothetical protein